MKLPFHEYADLFPILTGEDFSALVDDIKENGLLEPIWLFEGKILDGRNRYLACEEAKVEPRFVEYEGKDALGFVVSVNIKRRHLTLEQRAMLTLAVRGILEAEAKVRQIAGLKHGDKDAPRGGLKTATGSSAEQASKMVGIGEKTAWRLWSVSDKAPELLGAIKAGDLSIATAADLAQVDDKGLRGKLATKVVAEGLTTKQTEYVTEQIEIAKNQDGQKGVNAILKSPLHVAETTPPLWPSEAHKSPWKKPKAKDYKGQSSLVDTALKMLYNAVVYLASDKDGEVVTNQFWTKWITLTEKILKMMKAAKEA